MTRSDAYIVAALYHFTRFEDHKSLQKPLQALCDTHRVKGTLLLASEGINGTIAGTRAGIDAVLSHIRDMPGCRDVDHKESHASDMPFKRMKVRLKKEIVTMGQPNIDPLARVGNYVAPKDWNDLIAQEDVVVIDTRNDYEVAIGTFEGAIDPETKSFGEFPEWWQKNKEKYEGKKVAMFCTGGIRCEKSTNYLLNEGVKDVFHLKGGILKYLEEVEQQDSTWQGDCFVFDGRVSVGHGLEEGDYVLCYACRMPITPRDMMRPEFEKGVSCHLCFDQTDTDRKARFRERQRQVELAEKRSKHHIGN
ncbi:MAG: rhodanese-related sulfurtransferase [Pseudomonadota bacterium]